MKSGEGCPSRSPPPPSPRIPEQEEARPGAAIIRRGGSRAVSSTRSLLTGNPAIFCPLRFQKRYSQCKCHRAAVRPLPEHSSPAPPPPTGSRQGGDMRGRSCWGGVRGGPGGASPAPSERRWDGGSNPKDEFCLITRVLRHLEVQMFAICFKMRQEKRQD